MGEWESLRAIQNIMYHFLINPRTDATVSILKARSSTREKTPVMTQAAVEKTKQMVMNWQTFPSKVV